MSKPVPNPHVFEVTAENFEAEVVERSKRALVVIDFWAEWCAPCRLLGPILEKLAAEYHGRFVLAKAETERLPEIASAMGVRSIPAVFAIKGGRVVDSFVGALPESALREWINRNLPTPAETLVSEAVGLEPSDPTAAESKYRAALALEPASVPAKIGLGRVALALGRLDEARSIVQALERRGFLEPEAETLKAELTIHAHPEAGGGLDALIAAHQAEPADKPTQLRLAEGYAAAGRFEEALKSALELVERDRRGTGEDARKLMIAVFQLLPPDSELANEYRRQLSFAL
jgi:putative thioredoxin